jgi:hypothetical protein
MRNRIILSFAAILFFSSCKDNNDPNPQVSTPITPTTPTNGVVDDDADTFSYSLATGFNLADHEQTLDGGLTWSTATNPIIVGKVDKGLNQVGVRVKAANGRNTSQTLSNLAVFTSASNAIAPTNGAVNDTTNIFDYSLAVGFTLADHEQTLDGGNTWAAATKPIAVPNIAIPVNKVGIRVRGATGRNPSQALFNQQAFSISPTRTDLLINKNWRLIAETEAFGSNPPTNTYANRPACERDNLWIYSLTNTLVNDQGATKCSASDPQTINLNWLLSNYDSHLTNTFMGTTINDAEILRLTSNKLVIKETNQGTVRISTFTY